MTLNAQWNNAQWNGESQDDVAARTRRSYDPLSSRSIPYNQLFTTLIPGQQLPTEPLRHLSQAQGGTWWAETVKHGHNNITHQDPVSLGPLCALGTGDWDLGVGVCVANTVHT